MASTLTFLKGLVQLLHVGLTADVKRRAIGHVGVVTRQFKVTRGHGLRVLQQNVLHVLLHVTEQQCGCLQKIMKASRWMLHCECSTGRFCSWGGGVCLSVAYSVCMLSKCQPSAHTESQSAKHKVCVFTLGTYRVPVSQTQSPCQPSCVGNHVQSQISVTQCWLLFFQARSFGAAEQQWYYFTGKARKAPPNSEVNKPQTLKLGSATPSMLVFLGDWKRSWFCSLGTTFPWDKIIEKVLKINTYIKKKKKKY